ncbi:MAG: rhodanese-like domain-containing protein [Bacteroidota bacterium]|nr:rhodanese-like domain-containing protein [Bacteroidota bacterium]
MKKSICKQLFVSIFLLLLYTSVKAQTSPQTTPSLGPLNPWAASQLEEPRELAAILNSSIADKPVIFNIGAVEDIKGARHIGAVSEKETLEKFKKSLRGLPKTTKIIVYCGCCPFAKCPNIRPAFSLLTDMGFTNVKVLDMPVNLKTNWRVKGYPMAATLAH